MLLRKPPSAVPVRGLRRAHTGCSYTTQTVCPGRATGTILGEKKNGRLSSGRVMHIMSWDSKEGGRAKRVNRVMGAGGPSHLPARASTRRALSVFLLCCQAFSERVGGYLAGWVP